ncbi:MAG TPA: metalloregulator ArsR/SmtB family transcription factor [Microbacteriaceae bacterium]|jgi:DNA-binding transcriptional ArsR family regulator|nr:metalloregulator ArsR/SmtB family transcription factor [Microbacteriaceae bacterium]
MADIFDIVADATRRDILRVLLDASGGETPGSGDISVSEIVTTLELSQPTVSKHLKVLREAGLVRVREEGQHRYYHLDAGPLEDIEDWLIPFLSAGFDFGSEPLGSGIASETREFASSVGKVFADTSHRVTTAVGRVTKRRRD